MLVKYALGLTLIGSLFTLALAHAADTASFTLQSSAFKEGQFIPKAYTCQGNDVSPPLTFTGVPKSAKSITLVIEDPDAPLGTWQHWLLWNIPVQTTALSENTTPQHAIVGKNSAGKNTYHGPCPPLGTHRYYFNAYALDAPLTLSASSKRSDLDKAMKGHILAKATLMGRYKK